MIAEEKKPRVRELGFWIFLDTREASPGYRRYATIVGDLIELDDVIFIVIGYRPADIPEWPDPLEGAEYAVACFHTHPPATYRNTCSYGGASTRDIDHTNKQDVVGLVWDYIGWHCPGDDMGAPSKVYIYGPERSSTPR